MHNHESSEPKISFCLATPGWKKQQVCNFAIGVRPINQTRNV
jgi:hypothetical protein